MTQILGNVWWMIVTLGLLVTFHEFGHFIIARWCGVKVLKFSVGFGPALFSRFDRRGTEFVIAAIPLAGYVKMLDEREVEGVVGAESLKGAFNRKPVWARMAITAAGPVFNLIFTVAAFWLMFVVGRADYLPIMGQPTALAAAAGIREGDRILSVDGQSSDNWTSAFTDLIPAALKHQDVKLQLRDSAGAERETILALSQLPASINEEKLLELIGIAPKRPVPSAQIGALPADRPAALAGLKVGDTITAINDSAVSNFDTLYNAIQAQAKRNPQLNVHYLRGQQTGVLTMTAAAGKDAKGEPNFQIGIAPTDSHDALLRYGPLRAIPAAFGETWHMTRSTVDMLGLLVTGRASAKNISGPISIAQYAGESAHLGLASFLSFLALISLSLAIMNLLPIPVLDGGHLLYYLIELVKGSPVSERVMIAGQYAGMMLLAGLMSLAFYNDILRQFS